MSALTRATELEDPVAAAVDAVIEAGRRSAARGWVPATSGNFSVRIDAARIAATRSGVDKGALGRDDVLVQPLAGPLVPGSSAEAELHRRLYADDPAIGAIFHVHSLAATVIGAARRAEEVVVLTGWELQKAIAGVRSHEAVVEVPVFANDQDVPALAERVAARFASAPTPGAIRAPGYLLAGHGLYAWGAAPADAFRHLEALDVLFAQVIALRSIAP